LRSDAGGHYRGKCADEGTGYETTSHCFTPLALVLNKFFCKPNKFSRRSTHLPGAHTRRILCFHKNYSTGVMAVQKKTGFLQQDADECRGDATT
jgi:hypothetical protein